MFHRRIFMELLEVRSGAFENADGSFTVAAANPDPEEIAFSAPVSDICAVKINLRNGNDRLFLDNMHLPIDIRMSSGNDTGECQSSGDIYVSTGFGDDDIHCRLAGPSEIWGGRGKDFIIASRNDVEIHDGGCGTRSFSRIQTAGTG
ncbi:MAG: hypothetical protein HKN47_06105 [Pirellulaceae bacterium]|nr:hypothetical protein [Pirellulaceae bacterium]